MEIFDKSQAHQSRVESITQLSLQLLSKMYQVDALRFCYTINNDLWRKGSPSFRYTAITLLGLDAAKRCGFSVRFPVAEICIDLASHASEEKDLGNKALALWAALKLQSHAAGMALDALLAHTSFITNEHEGLIRSTELAWTIYALVMAWIDMETRGGGLLGRSMKDSVKKRLHEGIQILRSQRNGKTGLFVCAGIPVGRGSWRDRMKTTSGFFDSQVYGAMALGQAGQALDKPYLLQEAHKTILAVLQHQGKHGEWPWHYDIRDGNIIDPYPIFSVHQDGMGPMALLEVGELLGANFQEAVERSLQWIFGDNELHTPMIDQDSGLIWRAQRRKGVEQYVMQASRIAHHYRFPSVTRVLRAAPGRTIEYECRPYHLGWLLYAFCRQSQLHPDCS